MVVELGKCVASDPAKTLLEASQNQSYVIALLFWRENEHKGRRQEQEEEEEGQDEEEDKQKEEEEV